MALPLPTSLTPSKVASFKDCALAFRFSAIDRLPEPPQPYTTKGTLVHRALELLFCIEPPEQRTIPVSLRCLQRAQEELREHPEYTGLNLTPDEEATFYSEAEALLRNYFLLEDPRTVHPIGLELKLEVELGSLRLRGIIDRLELDAGKLVVTDFKTGKAPRERYEQGRLGGVHFYAFLCERLFGRRPDRIQLLYLQEPVAIIAEPSEQSIKGLEQRATAIWQAVERACATENFKPRPSGLCEWCSFRQYCPAWGGDPAQAKELLPLVPA
ncbi:MAG: PD-(D/E)XK nuclease family protein [Acidimicrobiia bacterium]|nr:PD-(D/E)XK nuclease family protein [Acidimicrobiia bacterium]